MYPARPFRNCHYISHIMITMEVVRFKKKSQTHMQVIEQYKKLLLFSVFIVGVFVCFQ